MAKKNQVTRYEMFEDMAREYITDPNDKLHHTIFKCGSVEIVEKGPDDAPEDTTVKIKGDDGHIYNFKGVKAYDAVSCGNASLMKYLDVQFYAEKDTKEVAAIYMQYTSGCTLLRADGYPCKLKLKQYSTRLMLVTEPKSVWAGDLGTMDASDIWVQSLYPALASANYQARSIFERALLFSSLIPTVLGLL